MVKAHRTGQCLSFRILIVAIIVLVAATVLLAQKSATPTPDSAELQRRIEKLEAQNAETVPALQANVDSLKTMNDAHRSFMTNFGGAFVGLITVLIAIQGLSVWSQARREKEARERETLAREDETRREKEFRDEERRRYDQRFARETQRDNLFAELGNLLAAAQRTHLEWDTADRQYREQRHRYEAEDRARAAVMVDTRERAEEHSTQQVRAIFTVVRDTLDTRLTAEKEAFERARKAESNYENMQNKFSALEQFVNRFQTTIDGTRNGIEAQARDIAMKNARHDFRKRTRVLSGFSERYDRFRLDYETLEVPPRTFSVRAQYVCGIAAHYSNQPENARTLLEAVSGSNQSELDEPGTMAKKRAGIARYFLGIIYSNFADYETALVNLSQSIQEDAAFRDFLSRIVHAEAKALALDYTDADNLLREIIERINQKDRADKGLPEFESRLRNRALLVRANILIQERPDRWAQNALALLDQIRAADPHYYFAIATQGQVYDYLQNRDAAKAAFSEAYNEIRNSGDLMTVTEARSRILLLLVAGMCAHCGQNDESRTKEHLDEAQARLAELPTMDGKVCRVFSPVTKMNETKETIEQHIKFIHAGIMLRPDDSTAIAAKI